MKRTMRLWACLAAAAVLAAGSTLHAEESYEGKSITAIEVQGLRSLPEDSLLYYLGVAKGQPLDEARLNSNIHALWEHHLIDNIHVEVTPEPGGVKLLVRVEERPVLRGISYDGLKRIGNTDISDRILKDKIRVHEGDPVDLGELQRLKASLEDMYRERGYRFAEVKLALEEISPAERRARFTVDEGDRVRIAKIRFEGSHVFSRLRLRWTMKKTKQTSLISRISKHDVYNPANLEEDLVKLRDLYRGDGYKNAVVGTPVVDIRALRPDALTAKEKKRRLFLTIPIEEGARWKFGSISIEGNKTYSDEILLRAFRRHSMGWLKSKVVSDGVEKITDTYRNTGFIDAHVDTELREREGNIADVVVHIDEGDQFRVGKLEFQGNTRTRDKVLRREVRAQEGMLLNIGALKNSVYKINQLQYFKLDKEDPIQFQNFDAQKKTVDLVVKGQEADRTELQIGGGYSEADGFFGQFSVRTQNFLGRGESVGLNYQSGGLRSVFDLSYSIPYFLDRPQSIGVQAFRNVLDYDLVSGQHIFSRSKGAVLTYGRTFGLFSSVSMSYTDSHVLDKQTLVGLDGALVEQDFSRDISSVRPAFVFDSRDSVLEPTRGQKFSVATDVAGGFLGGTTYYYRPEIGYSRFQPLTSYPLATVLGFNVETGMIRPYDGRRLFPLDRYLLGGENSLRGLRYRTVWVRDSSGNTIPDKLGFPQGGDKYFQANLEFHFLTGGPFRVVLFADAGNVYGCDVSENVRCRDGGFNFHQMRATAGAELRIFVPVLGAPLRFIYAFNLKPLPDERFDHFIFSIGTSF